MSFGSQILNFYQDLKIPSRTEKNIEVMVPFENNEVRLINAQFYEKFYNDNYERFLLIGINPGRFGAGLTGIPFVDPVNLEQILGIKNSFNKKHELSSEFIFKVIDGFRGPEIFFSRFYLTAVCPLGFIRNGKNINYYEIESIRNHWQPFFIQCLKKQLKAGGRKDVAFILGQGENYRFLKMLNEIHGIFAELIALPHPRWVMQYRFPQRMKYVRQYIKALSI